MLPARLRTFFFPACLVALTALVTAFELQDALGLLPCLLCLTQRVLLAGYVLVCLSAVLHGPTLEGQRRYAQLALGFALGGAAVAARQVWLQGVVVDDLVCPVAIDRNAGQYWNELARQLFSWAPDCNALTWSFMDLTLPEWSLMAFVLLAALALGHLLASRLHALIIHDLEQR
ncbi:disulfide bond formation protein B [Pseudomonas fulva]|uniref:disulfide bond formation protein B n=1 Tax=Pseudomonas fulva TaxID=47880 RepID=UPI0018AA568E|nr:disulfide bond formation protein B [Pseudomonas fulva]MBF8677928.1 disulfide bond formation protein B [Pseudomonas fulva]MBF8716340.1 disulfide bond formation protein B [Pseudomonas fulva]MBF8782124.1 disulfide bond formation protein B [Pseudomonas fulva]